MENKWIECPENKSKTFRLEDEPVLLHIIKTGFKDNYMIIWEDGTEQFLGDVQFNNKQQIEKKFNIKL